MRWLEATSLAFSTIGAVRFFDWVNARSVADTDTSGRIGLGVWLACAVIGAMLAVRRT